MPSRPVPRDVTRSRFSRSIVGTIGAVVVLTALVSLFTSTNGALPALAQQVPRSTTTTTISTDTGSGVGSDAGGRLPPPSVPPDRARERAKEILSKPEYQPPPKTWLDRLLEWIGEHLGGAIGSLFGTGGSVFAWILLVVLMGAAGFLISRIRGSGQWRRTIEPDGVDIEVEVRRTVTEWRREAERLEAEGKWKEALRARYRELIGRLIEDEVVRDVPGRTTGEYRFEVARNAPGVAGEFSGATELFDRAWYGDRPTGPDENKRFRELASVVLGGARTEGPRELEGASA